MIKYIVLLLFLTVLPAEDDFTVFIKCSKNCVELSNPSIAITLIASCRGKCVGVSYKWHISNIDDNQKQDLSGADTLGEHTQIIIIKKDVLLRGEHYTAAVTATKRGVIKQATYILHMDKCSKKYPCKEDRDIQQIAEDYVELVVDKIREIFPWETENKEDKNKNIKKKKKATKATKPTTTKAPKVVVANVANEMNNLKALKNDPDLMYSKSIELITKLNDVNLEDPAVLKDTVKILKQYLELNVGKMKPNLARATARLAERILDKELERIKKTPNQSPTEASREIHDVAVLAIRALDQSFNENKALLEVSTTTEKAIVSVTIPAIMVENNPDNVEFDIVYQGKKKNFAAVSQRSINTANKIGRANALTMPNRTKEEKIHEGDTCILNIVDSPSALSEKTFSTCDASIYFTNRLALEIQNKMTTATITFSVIKKNLFWWQNKNISTNVISMELSDTKKKKFVTTFKNPLLISSKLKKAESNFVPGYIKMPADSSGLLFEQEMCVHQLVITEQVKTLLIQFQNVKDTDNIQVAVFKNYRPSAGDFANSHNIPNKNQKDKFTIMLNIHAPPGSFYYVGVLPSKETIKNSGTQADDLTVYNYNVRFASVQCFAWIDYAVHWKDNYCNVNEKTNSDEIYCDCYHLTTFVGSVSRIESKVSELLLIDIRLLRQYNFIVLIIVIICLLLFVCALLIALWKDRQISKPRKVLFMMDNNPYHKYKYILAVHTGFLKNSGTTANIGVKLYGSHANSEEHLLRGQEEPVLQTGRSDNFMLLTQSRLGELKSIDLWSDCYGIRCSWYCKKIIIYNLDSNKQWIFEVNRWLSILTKTLMISVTVVNTEIFIPRTKWDFVALAMKTEHLWFSIFKTSKHPAFTYVEKITVMYGIVVSCMFFAFLLYGPPSPQLYGQLGIGHYEFRGSDFAITLFSAIFSFGFSFGFIYFFINSHPLHPTSLSEQFTYTYPNKWRFRCWILLITMIVFFSLILLVFGLFLSYFPSMLWITNSVIAILVCIFIFETARVVIIALRVRETPSTYIDKSFDSSEISKVKHILRKKHGADGLRPLFYKNYQPLSDFEIKVKLEKELQRIQLRNIVIDIIMFLAYLIILFCVVLINKDSMALYSTQNIENIFVKDRYLRVIPYTDLNSKRRFFRYLRKVYFPAIYAKKWYANLTTDETGLLVDFNTKLLGIPRIRQIRILDDSCTVPAAMRFITDDCNPEYSSLIQSKLDYGPKWREFTRKNKMKDTDKLWLYQSGWESQSSAILGDLAYYPSGGYVALLGRTERNSRVILQYIDKSKWIDELTRAVFIEACFYNANQNLFSMLTLIVEISASGSFINNYSIRTSKLLFRIDELAIGTFIIFGIFFIMILILSWKTFKQVRKSYILTFLSDVWNIIDLAIILFAFTFLIVYFCRSVAVSALLKRLEDAAHNEFVSFTSAMFWDDSVTVLACALVAISTTRAWKLLRFLRMFRICELTLSLAAKYLLAMTFINLIIMFTYSSAGYLIFGAYSIDFRTIGGSFVSLILLAFGFNKGFNYDALERNYAGIGYLYYFCYMILLMIIINLFITIIIVAYESAREFFDCSEVEKLVSYNMLNFLKDEFHYYTSKTKGREEIQRLHAGEDKTEISEDINGEEITHKPDVLREEVRVNSKKLKAMHDITATTLEILIQRFEKKNVTLRPDIIAVVLANRITEPESDEDNAQEVDELFITVPSDNGYKYCSKKRMEDMLVIVHYLMMAYGELKHETTTKLANAADKHQAMLITMTNIVLDLSKTLDNLTTNKYADKSTGVTFEDLGLEIVNSDNTE